jgi:hypothetical protein
LVKCETVCGDVVPSHPDHVSHLPKPIHTGDVHNQPPLLLPRSAQRVTIQLPPGFLPGSYEVQLLDADLRSRAAAKGVAEMRDYVATIEATIDVSTFPAGTYQVAVRREGESWRMFPAQLR